jgi:hypothetical protein
MVDRAWTASYQVLSCAMHELHGATSFLQKFKIPLSLSAPGKAMAPAALTNGAHEHVQFLTVVP